MKTKILDPSDLSLAVDILKRGEPVVFPTETVYGLGAPVFNPKAIQRIFEIKGRPSDNPLIVHISSIGQAELLSDSLPPLFYELAKKFWPGPLTLIVRRRAEVPGIVSAGHPTIAIRMPSHPTAKSLIDAVGEPLAAPSANLSGRPSPTRFRDVLEDLDGKVEAVLAGEDCEIGIESTVLNLLHPIPALLRPGKITKEQLEQVIGQTIQLAAPSDPVLSPGMKYRHYAPKAPIRLIYLAEELRGPFILSPVLIPGKAVRPLDSKLLYSQLREADRLGVPFIEIYCHPSILKDPALMNRLLRASGSLA